MTAPLGGDDGDLGAPTINTKKHRWQSPKEVVPEVSQGIRVYLKLQVR
jgi:hypothetical protein